MFIILSIIGCLFPIFGITLGLLYFNQYRSPFRSAVIQGLSWSGALYGYVGDQGNDIYRHMNNLALYRNVPLYKCFDLLKDKNISAVYTWDIWSWIVARFNNPYLLQASGALIGYTILSYILFDYVYDKEYSRKEWIPIWIFMLSTVSPLNIAIGIRYGNAILIFCLAVYLFYYKNRKITPIILCIISIFLHHGAILLVICWAVLPFFKKHKIIGSAIVIALLFTFDNYGYYLSLLFGRNGAIADLFSNTMYSAASYQENGINNSFHAIVARLLLMFFNVSLLIRTRTSLKKHGEDNSNDYNIWSLSLIITIVTFSMLLLIGSNGSRFFMASDIICILLLLQSRKYISPYLTWPMGVCDWLILATALGNIAIYLYDMNYGTGSLFTFLRGLVFGYLSRTLFVY